MKTAPTSSIKFVMAAKAVSLRDLSKKTGLSYGYVSNLVSGSKKSEKGLSAITQALEMDQFLSDIEPAASVAQSEPGKDAE